jgi:23S rRNA pseudouridine2605 synthase
MEQRLQKIIAAAGIASRRKAEAMIAAGQVTVNGRTVRELGAKADPDEDRISVNGRPLRAPEQKLYILLNKPKGYVSTVSDPQQRRTVLDLVRGLHARLYPVGRLDYHSEGLLLLTNDGDFAQQMTHASFHIPKTYLVKVSGHPTEEELRKLRGGIAIDISHPFAPKAGAKRMGQPQRRWMPVVKTAPSQIRIIREGANPWLEVTLIEGRNRQLHRMFERVGHHVEKIKRVRLGPLTLDVEPGRFRPLSQAEVKRLKQMAAGEGKNKRGISDIGPSLRSGCP